ncbi:MAG: hypothetical protein JWO56_2044 [Acidobacteria bacterium]|nr:hypothetical protein [Acidobacteriota bacterium]
MTSPFRLLVIADVGGEEARHIGDEAMLEANLDGFRRLIPDVAFTVVSRDPAWTAARYGVDAIAPLGFPRDLSAGAERDAMLDRLLAEATARDADATARRASVTAYAREDAILDAVARARGVVVSGGGNLSSTWPDLLYERVALLQLARIFQKPAVVLGQTIGPQLSGDECRLLAAALSSARFVGVRELPTAALVLEMGIPQERIWYQCDDGLFLDGDGVATLPGKTGAIASPPLRPAIAVTIDPQLRAAREAVFGPLAEQLRELSETTGAPLILIPHAFGNESPGAPSDLTEAHALAERLGLADTVIAAGLDARQVRELTGEAALVISSRYHPIVFGLAAGIPAIGIHGDEYCRIKLQGALAHAGTNRWTLTYEDVSRGALLTCALELWRLRDELRRELEARREGWRDEARERWAAVVRALDPAAAIPPVSISTMFGRPIQEVAAPLAAALEAHRQAWARLAARCEEAERYARHLKNERGTLRRYASALRSKLRRMITT